MSSPVPPIEPEALSPAEKVKQFPLAPGVYLMKDGQGRVIYIGKAKNLRSRVRSYFQAGPLPQFGYDIKTRELIRQIADVEFIVTDNEELLAAQQRGQGAKPGS